MKRLISIMLTLALMFSISTAAFAHEESSNANVYTESITANIEFGNGLGLKVHIQNEFGERTDLTRDEVDQLEAACLEAVINNYLHESTSSPNISIASQNDMTVMGIFECCPNGVVSYTGYKAYTCESKSDGSFDDCRYDIYQCSTCKGAILKNKVVLTNHKGVRCAL